MRKLNNILLVAFIILFGNGAYAQQNVEMADGMRSDGKIYVVVAIVLAILFGFIFYLFMLDRKISKVEKQLDAIKSK